MDRELRVTEQKRKIKKIIPIEKDCEIVEVKKNQVRKRLIEKTEIKETK